MGVMPQSSAHLSEAQLAVQERRRVSLGNTICDLRHARGLTQTQLAAAVGISKRGVIRIEQGQTSLTVDILGRFADALGVRPSELLRLAEERDAADSRSRLS